MESKDMERKWMRTSAVMLAIAIILGALAFSKAKTLGGKILLLCIAAIPFLIALLFIYSTVIAHRYRKGEHNFFLYDPRLRKNRPVEDLTFEHVSTCLTRYMALFRRGRQLYLASLFDEDGGAPESFKPLFCYQLLGMLTASPSDEQWKAFLLCGKELADAFSTYLTQADEEELARKVQNYIADFDGENIDPFREYILSKSDYLADRMLEYTRNHIHDFD